MTSYPLTQVRPQGIQHILTLAGATSFGLLLFASTGSFLVAIPVALGSFYQLWKTSDKMREPDYCNALEEFWTYRLSPSHPNIDDSYDEWCHKYGVDTINGIIEPMIGNCHYANFANNPEKYAYPGLQGVLVYDCEEPGVPPLAPHHYVEFRLQQREEAIARSRQFVPTSATTRHQEPASPPAIRQPPILVAAEVVEPSPATPDPSSTLDTAPATSDPVSEPPQFARPSTEPEQDVFQFLLSLTQAPLQPVIWAGPPGAGKGTAESLALQLGKKRNGLRYWVFNSKAKIDEAGYWAGADHHFLKDRLDVRETRIFEDLMEVLDQFCQEGTRRNNQRGQHPPFVLVIEEINTLIGKFTPKQKEEFKTTTTAMAGLLRGANMAIWLSGQSVNLDEIGLGSRSNRAIFTAIVCVAEDRDSVAPACELLGIEYDKNSLKPGHRYWLTSTATYLALPAPLDLPQYDSWADVPNLVDMRRTVTPQQPAQPQGPTDEELWADYIQWKGSDRQWQITRLGDEGGSYHKKLEKLKARFATSETVSEPAAVA